MFRHCVVVVFHSARGRPKMLECPSDSPPTAIPRKLTTDVISYVRACGRVGEEKILEDKEGKEVFLIIVVNLSLSV